MQWMTQLVPRDSAAATAERITEACQEAFADRPVHLIFLFVSPATSPILAELTSALRDRLGPRLPVVGCTGAGLAVDGREFETTDGIAVMAGHLPDVGVVPFYADPETARTRTPAQWRETLGLIAEQQPVFVLLPDPFSVDGQALATQLDAAFPGCPKVGGLASGGRAPGTHRVICGDRVERAGVVGVALWGDVRLTPLVAQGARPIGPLLSVTAADGRSIRGLDGRPVLEVLEELFSRLSQTDRQAFQQGPAVGIAPVGDTLATLRSNDFLVRDMLGFKRSENALVIGATVQVGDRIQLRVRDAASADAELRELADRLARHPSTAAPACALMFTCLGRGERFFSVPDHDVSVVRARLGAPPLVGFFCNGELGPVRGRTWQHGYTSSFAFLSARGWS